MNPSGGWEGWSEPYEVPMGPQKPPAWRRHRLDPGGRVVEVVEVPAPLCGLTMACVLPTGHAGECSEVTPEVG